MTLSPISPASIPSGSVFAPPQVEGATIPYIDLDTGRKLADLQRRADRTAAQVGFYKALMVVPLILLAAGFVTVCAIQGVENNRAYAVAMGDHQ